MKYKSLVLTVLLAAFARSALTQDKISGTCKGDKGKPDTSQSIEVGDQAGHVLIIDKSSCTWSVPFEMAGLKTTTSTGAETVDMTSTKFQDRGYQVMSMDNGDKAYVSFQGRGTILKEVIEGKGTWSFTGGTGKLKGLKGKGTYKGIPDGFEAEGEYSLPEANATAKKK